MHLTDSQLNEYLDQESGDEARLETHLNSCPSCQKRLSNLQTLFAELDSLPEAALTRNIAAHFLPEPALIAPPPRWLTLTAFAQAVAALATLIIAIPFFSAMLPLIEIPNLWAHLIQVQTLWANWLNALATLRLPAFEPLPMPTTELSTLLIMLTSVSVIWILGNGLLLRNRS